ncbi:MAG: Adenylosuccinate lyase [Alphaproteobacteria bacterium MarineAlpha2_Bin1]|nr:MAG: Adenylosuccinate lyase [Alphaproteobacteria bacterium MarineAlpha2_Bin1]
MIPRYSTKDMSEIWSEETKFQIWFDIETHACDAHASLGLIPQEAARIIKEKGKFQINKINDIEKRVHHDVIAFLTNLSENIGPEARFIHQGMTSSDILDTCLSIQLIRASDILLNSINKLLESIKKRALEFKYSPCVGRSHGIHAEPTTFGLKLAQAFAEFSRNKNRLLNAKKDISICSISGAVGTFANIDPRVEKYVSEKLGLETETISTQIIPRDRHAYFFSILAIIASSIERLSIEIRHLQRTEVMEVEEFFSDTQKGSSAMPHKRNPVLSENLSGIARLVRGYSNPILENVALWHERDISHSSVERVIAPDATIALDFALNRLNDVIDRLVVYPKRMLENLDELGGLIFSQRVLLALIDYGLSREKAYEVVQKNAMIVWKNKGNFLEQLKKDPNVSSIISDNELENLFNLEYHLKYVDKIFDKVFN